MKDNTNKNVGLLSIQALERIADDLPMSAGKPLAREFEYKRGHKH